MFAEREKCENFFVLDRSAVTDIVNNQRVSKILVGDKHQQIYAFRGAVNAMEKIESTMTFYLTKVFIKFFFCRKTFQRSILVLFSVISIRIRSRVLIEFDPSEFVQRKEISRWKQEIKFEELRKEKKRNEKLGWNFLDFLDGRSAPIDAKITEQKAYLFRTNFSLFNCAVQMIIERGIKSVGFVGVR